MFDSTINKKNNLKFLILHNIRSVINVGAIFRTADAIGIDQIFLTGYTPAPIDRFGRERKDFQKSALGAEKKMKWQECESIFDLIEKLKKENFKIIALEQADNSVDYKKIEINYDSAIILGNETDGIEKEVLDLVDIIAELPMVGSKESLNVSVATGILLFRLFDK